MYREELRERFLKAEVELFKARFETDDTEERRQFIDSLALDWAQVSHRYISRLRDTDDSVTAPGRKRGETAIPKGVDGGLSDERE